MSEKTRISRKLAVGLLLVVIAVVMEYTGPQGLTDVMSTFLLGMGIGYFLANGLVKGVQAVENVKKPKGSDAVLEKLLVISEQLKDLKEDKKDDSKEAKLLQSIHNQNVILGESVNTISKGVSMLVGVVNKVNKT